MPHDLTSGTSHSPIVVTSSNDADVGWEGWHLFDGVLKLGEGGPQTGTWWVEPFSNPAWVKIDLGVGNETICGSYSLKAYHAEYYYTPKNWTLQGSNNDADWYVVDTKTNVTPWDTWELKTFNCDVVTTAYRYFKLNITAINGVSDLVLNEMYMYEA